jgi:hypothetical protein
MASLLDLGPLTEEVEIRGVTLTIQGLTAVHLFKLFAEFPDMGQAISQIGNHGAKILEMAPDLIAKIIATATGSAGDKAVEDKARAMGAADQMLILSAVQRLSFPDGISPFVEQITKLMGAPVMGAISPETLRAPSNASLQTESPGMTRGTSPRVN